ncbi:MAG: bifunctional oligoribonuclease/PAP phosphatase NrnA, partial [Bdellovibrionales bacterium]|nr:bifunctional oligoribonuclease/PAP phosphatase NrnA [Bdellovibrionales bacterium]
MSSELNRSACPSDILTAIGEATKVLVISHFSPDSDAYGSSCALTGALEKMGKQAVCLNESGILRSLQFVPGVENVVSKLPKEDFDLVLVLDCGDEKRVGDTLTDFIRKHPKVVNIDHHASNTLFGDLNWVVSDACSTSELIFDLLCDLGFEFTPDVAEALLIGIYGDTGSFRNLSTSARSFEIAAKLVAHGANPAKIAAKMYESLSPSSFRMRAFLLSQAEFRAEGRVVISIASAQDYRAYGATAEDTEGVVEELRSIGGVRVSCFIREVDGIWRVSLRSKDPKLDVSKVAAQFGGGGHVVAAAFRFRQSIEKL